MGDRFNIPEAEVRIHRAQFGGDNRAGSIGKGRKFLEHGCVKLGRRLGLLGQKYSNRCQKCISCSSGIYDVNRKRLMRCRRRFGMKMRPIGAVTDTDEVGTLGKQLPGSAARIPVTEQEFAFFEVEF